MHCEVITNKKGMLVWIVIGVVMAQYVGDENFIGSMVIWIDGS